MRILLCCAAGMSTSLLVANMEKEAKNAGEDHEIWAVSADEATKQIEGADVLLLGPQVRYLLPSLKKLGEEKNIPVDAINPVHYGTVNGKEVLKYAKEFSQTFSGK